jgi:O-antigen/teichoic acid export membrane protein
MVPFILLGYVFYGINQVFLPGIYFEKKTRYLAYITVFASGVNILFNFLLIPLLGLVGSAMASFIGYFVLACSTYFVSQRLFRVPYEKRRVAILFLISFVAGSSAYFFSLPVVIKIIIILTFPLILRISGFFKKEEINSLKILLLFR